MASIISQFAGDLSVATQTIEEVVPNELGVIPALSPFNSPNSLNEFVDIVELLGSVPETPPSTNSGIDHNSDKVMDLLPKGSGASNQVNVPEFNDVVLIHDWLLNGGGTIGSVLNTLINLLGYDPQGVVKILDPNGDNLINGFNSNLGIVNQIVSVLISGNTKSLPNDILNYLMNNAIGPLIQQGKNAALGAGQEFYNNLFKDKPPRPGVEEIIIDPKGVELSSPGSVGEILPTPTTPESQGLYSPEVIEFSKKISILPFGGYFHNNLGSFEMASEHIWDIKIEPYFHKGKRVPRTLANGTVIPHLPEPPSVNGFLPVTEFDITEAKSTSNAINLYEGSSISIPERMVFDKSINISFLEDRFYSIRTWLEKYRDYMYDNFKTMPYKHCCYRITVWILDFDRSILYQKTYLGIADDIDVSIKGNEPSNRGIIIRSVNFNIVGEGVNQSTYSQLESKQLKNQRSKNIHSESNPVVTPDYDDTKVIKIVDRIPKVKT